MIAFEAKLAIFEKQFSEENFQHIPSCNDLTLNKQILSSVSVKRCTETLKLLKEEFGKDIREFLWPLNRNSLVPESLHLITRRNSWNLWSGNVNLQTIDGLKTTFKENNNLEFYACLRSMWILKLLLHVSIFGSTSANIFKSEISKIQALFRAYWWTSASNLRLSVISIDIVKLAEKVQNQVSHYTVVKIFSFYH